MRTLMASCVALALAAGCSHRENIERKDPLNDQVTGSLTPTDRAFLKDDPAARIACHADAQCPQGALCAPDRHVCFTSYPGPEVTKIDVTCPLVPLYFASDSTDLVPEAKKWIDHDVACLKARGAHAVVVQGFADTTGDAQYNTDLSKRRAEAVRDALADRGLTIDVSVQGAGESELIRGTSEHDYAYNRRVDLDAK
jgi:outer membrane protein OmpA-like peptidoglycan-associated protein